jgi:hypothetical protein
MRNETMSHPKPQQPPQVGGSALNVQLDARKPASFTEWLVFTANIEGSLSDRLEAAGNRTLSAIHAGRMAALQDLAKSEWASRYDEMSSNL